jgi:hypothetical protein
MIDIANRVQVGQTVRLENLAHGYEIVVLADKEPGLVVVDVGPDYLVLHDADAGVRTRIPSHFLRFAPPATQALPQAA